VKIAIDSATLQHNGGSSWCFWSGACTK